MMVTGLLKAQYIADKTARLVYSLGAKGFSDYISEQACVRKEIDSASIMHDLILVNIAAHIRTAAKVKVYYPENIIRTLYGVGDQNSVEPFRELSSDAVLQLAFLNGDFYVALEYEASLKTRSRIEQKLRAYQMRSEIAGVLYVCRNVELLKQLQNTEKHLNFNESSKFYYTTLEELWASNTIQFKSADNGILALS